MLKIRFLSGGKISFQSATLGCFDGLHLGHQHLIQNLAQPACLIKIVPNPKFVLNKIPFAKKILTLRLFLDDLKKFKGLAVALLRFDKKVRNLESEEFLTHLADKLPIREIILGKDAKLGSDQKSILELKAHPYVRLRELDLKLINGKKISSTLLREAVTSGDLNLFFSLTNRFIELDIKQFGSGLSCCNLHPLMGAYRAVCEGSEFRVRFHNRAIEVIPHWSKSRGIFRLLEKVP